MQTNVQLSPELAAAIQLRADQEGRQMHDVIADVLAANFPLPTSTQRSKPIEKMDLPVIKTRPLLSAEPSTMIPEEWHTFLKSMELQADVEGYEKALGHQYVDRASS